MTKILFLHGWTSTPGGLKPTFLRQHGHEVLNPALPDDDFGRSVAIAEQLLREQQPAVIVGSSRGGAVAVNMASRLVPLVLLCPAWKHWGTATTVTSAATILHSPDDEVIPFADSQELLANSSLSETHLRIVGSDHRLADPQSLAAMLQAVEESG